MKEPAAERVLQALAERGLLLKQDKSLPNVVSMLTGESLRTSWWSHPKGRLIWAVLERLAEHPDVLFTKLLSRKDTLVHRRLWPSVLAVAYSREPWQKRGLSPAARRLLAKVDRGDGPVPASGAPVKELEERLLAHAEEVHTKSGRHEMAVEAWSVWAKRAGCAPARSVSAAREALEHATRDFGAPLQALPWHRAKRKGKP